MLERIGDVDNAEKEFRELLAAEPDFAAARLQLGRLLQKQKRDQEAVEHAVRIIDGAEKSPGTIAPTVLLEAFRLLATAGTAEQVKTREAFLMATVAGVRQADTALAHRLIAAVAGKTSYTEPDLAFRLFSQMDSADLLPSTDGERFDYAQAHKSAAKASIIPTDKARLLKIATASYQALSKPNAFHRINHAEALLLLGEYGAAIGELEQVPAVSRDAFWLQRHAQALRGRGAFPAALASINGAIETSTDDKHKKYRGAFLHDRWLIRESMGDVNAVDDLRAAIASLPIGNKFRIELEGKLSAKLGG